MTGKHRITVGFALAAMATMGTVALSGCNAETKLTAKEQANIKGSGEMPPEVRQKMAKMQEDAQKKMQEANKGPVSPQ